MDRLSPRIGLWDGTPSVNIIAAPPSHMGTTTGSAAGPLDGSYEKNLVLELCPLGGV